MIDLNNLTKLYYSIGEVAEIFNVNTSLIRFWEKEFPQLKPKLRAKGRRYYTPENVQLLKKIQYLLKDKGLTIKGAKKIIENNKQKQIDYE